MTQDHSQMGLTISVQSIIFYPITSTGKSCLNFVPSTLVLRWLIVFQLTFSQILLTPINMILLNQVYLHPLLHIHKPTKQPSSKANEVQIIPVLSVGKIQSHILYFLCGQENKAQTLLWTLQRDLNRLENQESKEAEQREMPKMGKKMFVPAGWKVWVPQATDRALFWWLREDTAQGQTRSSCWSAVRPHVPAPTGSSAHVWPFTSSKENDAFVQASSKLIWLKGEKEDVYLNVSACVSDML